MTKDEVITNLQDLAIRYKDKKYLTLKEIDEIPNLQFQIQHHFRGLAKALHAANLPSSKLASAMNITNEDLLSYLLDLRNKLDRNPKVIDFYEDEELYRKYSEYQITWQLYKGRFGGMKNAFNILDKKTPQPKSAPQVTLEHQPKAEEYEHFWEKKALLGQAAEIHVMAELLYRGFQAANIPVDVGLDILAVKNNRTFYFQVKHKDLSNNQVIKITKSSFDKTGSGEVYYIFVLLSEEIRDFIIIPYHLMNEWIRENLVEDTVDGYLVNIKKKDNQYILKEKTLNNYLNNWDIIK